MHPFCCLKAYGVGLEGGTPVLRLEGWVGLAPGSLPAVRST